jgi:hypothetical protein
LKKEIKRGMRENEKNMWSEREALKQAKVKRFP